MSFNFDDQVQKLTEFLKTEAKTETVVGQSFQLGEFTCVPVIKFGMGLGYGGGEGKGDAQGKGAGEGTGGGAGGGVGVEPIGFLVTRGDQISFLPTRNAKGLSSVFEKLPDMLDKFMDKKTKDKAATTA
ncbi:GerW family sporulation protein [Flavitalea sp. BT771]|uniref:GerW family sporulation protein n=1 Tax=Flavitalea sp. BT771 TaxID=3063329 RepID=UPI0026E23CBF|nr:GerW family sporulation protein [Flavitalea sp. BT771]MDO6432884.1 GerW family sporulation protein [Flavitalea sp. BT771]MDV6221840.1 GerW family sporulation protein [Flavitalea sp. BT771]